MSRVEADRAEVAETAGELALVRAAHGVTVVLDQEEVAGGGQFGYLLHLVGVAECVRDHDGPGARADRLRYALDRGVVGAQLDVDEDRGEPVLHDRVDRRGKAGRHGDDLVPRDQPGVPEYGGGQGGERQQVGGGAGVGEVRLADVECPGQRPFEPPGGDSRGDPHLQRRLHERHPVFFAQYRSGRQDRCDAGFESRGPPGGLLIVFPYQLQDLCLGVHLGLASSVRRCAVADGRPRGAWNIRECR